MTWLHCWGFTHNNHHLCSANVGTLKKNSTIYCSKICPCTDELPQRLMCAHQQKHFSIFKVQITDINKSMGCQLSCVCLEELNVRRWILSVSLCVSQTPSTRSFSCNQKLLLHILPLRAISKLWHLNSSLYFKKWKKKGALYNSLLFLFGLRCNWRGARLCCCSFACTWFFFLVLSFNPGVLLLHQLFQLRLQRRDTENGAETKTEMRLMWDTWRVDWR